MLTPSSPCNALVFLHIPKTGGTSMIQALRACFAEADCFTADCGNLSPDLLRGQPDALRRTSLFYGHPTHAVLDLTAPAQLLTVLRRPEDHAVSNYLYLQRSPGLPLHDAARTLGFTAFLRAHWQALVFQAISLDVPQSAGSIGPPEEFFRRLPSIQALLDRIDFVGCLDRVHEVLQVLACARGWPAPEPLPLLHRAADAGVDPQYVVGLRGEYLSLWDDPACAPLLAAEQGLYAQAQRIARRQFASARPPAMPQRGTTRWQRFVGKIRAPAAVCGAPG